jgi:CAAX prenyl protease-like protein
MIGSSQSQRAYFGPFLVFLGLIGLGEFVKKIFEGQAVAWPLSTPMYWVMPAQTLICGWLLLRWWRHYELRPPARPVFTILIGLVVLGLWVAPQELLHAEPRLDGFEPGYFGGGAPYWFNLLFRFVRLVIVVPLVEEIFWRGYLLRYLIHEDFTKVPFGKFSWLSFAVVTAGFTFEHAQSDWPAAALAGALYNLVAYRTRSLSACVLAHAVTNFALGLYVLRTGQWGFW